MPRFPRACWKRLSAIAPVLRRMNRQSVIWLLLGLLSCVWVVAWTPQGLGQLPTPAIQQKEPSPPKVSTRIERLGNIEYAYVTFDGVQLFQIAAPAASTDADAPEAPTVYQRVTQVENNLSEVVARQYHPSDLQVVAGRLNNQPVIFVSDNQGLRRIQIVTVTGLDARVAGKSETELVNEWTEVIRDCLTQALVQRQPNYLRAQAIRALQILGLIVLVSCLLALVQRWLKSKWNVLNCQAANPTVKAVEEMGGAEAMQDLATNSPLQFLALKLPEMTLTRKRNVNLILRRLLQWCQVSLWLGYGISILTLFPQTREQGQWLLGLPMRLLGILLVMGLANKMSQVFIDYSLQAWAEQESLNPLGAHRQACRVPTYSVALKGVSSLAALVIGSIWVLYELKVPIAPVLTGAGILGFALSFSAQSLIRDMINGCLILLEDQYAVGDVISVGNEMGFVEHMSLRITQLRDPDGELVTIPNGSITTVRNLSNGWSRVNFEVEVSYDTDVDKAMRVIETVAETMRNEPIWMDRIIEPAEILGVDKLAHDGILIRVWIKTKPLQQWNVSREFRRRLRHAFQEHDVPIGVPQQFLWIRNGSDLVKLEQVLRSHAGENGKNEKHQDDAETPRPAVH